MWEFATRFNMSACEEIQDNIRKCREVLAICQKEPAGMTVEQVKVICFPMMGDPNFLLSILNQK